MRPSRARQCRRRGPKAVAADRRPLATVGKVCPSGCNPYIGNLSWQAYPEQIGRQLFGKEFGGSNCRFVVDSHSRPKTITPLGNPAQNSHPELCRLAYWEC